MGIDIAFKKNRSIIFMKDYMKEIFGLFEENLDATVVSPAKKGLYILHETSPILNKQDADIIQYMISTLLWVANMWM